MPPLRCCLLSGGASRRMGRDKALLAHPEGGTWLERTLRLLATLEAPITLLSRHPAHLELARALGAELVAAAGNRTAGERDGIVAESIAAASRDGSADAGEGGRDPAFERAVAGTVAATGDAVAAGGTTGEESGRTGRRSGAETGGATCGAAAGDLGGRAEPQRMTPSRPAQRSPQRPGDGDRIAGLTALAEPSPWQGPLQALARLMECHPGERLLLCPVDMPWLDAASLRSLLAAEAAGCGAAAPGSQAAMPPGAHPARGLGVDSPPPADALIAAAGAAAPILLAHDGERLQPLLGIYPATADRRRRLTTTLAAGQLGLQRWLAGECWRAVPLEARALRNVNSPGDWQPDR